MVRPPPLTTRSANSEETAPAVVVAPPVPAPPPLAVTPSPSTFTASSGPGDGAEVTPSHRVKPPPLPPSATGANRRPLYVPDTDTLVSRPVRTHTVFAPYASRPTVVFRDRYNHLFWWWLLDRATEDRARWAYHHRDEMDPARYQALVADNRALETRIEELEAQQLPRDPNFVPAGLDRDLMYSDRFVEHAYSIRPTTLGRVAFWVLAIPTALGLGFFFIWLVFFKRWQTAT